MYNEFQSHVGKRQFKISSFIQGRVVKAKKLNNSFLFHNSRMISLFDNGMLVYYRQSYISPSKQPDLFKEKPKCGVYFQNVYHSCVKLSEKEVELIVKFKKSQLYHFENVNESHVKEQGSQEIVLWIFRISINNLEENKLQSFKTNKIYSLQQSEVPDQAQNTQKNILQSVRAKKTSIQSSIIMKDIKNKKQVQWLDLQTEKLIYDNNQFHKQGIQSEQLSQDDQWEINEESVDLIIKNIQIKRSSLTSLVTPKQQI